MKTNIQSVLMVVENKKLRELIYEDFANEQITVLLASSIEEAKSILSTTTVSCILVTDKLAASYNKTSNISFQGISATIPTLILITELPSKLIQIFDKYYRPPYALYEYLPLPVGMDEILAILGRMVEATAKGQQNFD
jgi:DNA-binding NtrC family response regulator